MPYFENTSSLLFDPVLAHGLRVAACTNLSRYSGCAGRDSADLHAYADLYPVVNADVDANGNEYPKPYTIPDVDAFAITDSAVAHTHTAIIRRCSTCV